MDQWKLIQMKGDLLEPKWELYHLESDPTESICRPGTLQSVLRFQSEMRELDEAKEMACPRFCSLV